MTGARFLLLASIERLRVGLALARHRAAPVLVYQMGRVGSVALTRALLGAGVRPVFHVHNLRPGVRHPRSRALRWALVGRDRPLRVITLVREPIAQSVSSFFNNFQADWGRPPDNVPDLDELTSLYLQSLRHTVPLLWFSRQLHDVLGIDVYARPFPRAEGALRFEDGRCDTLIVKVESDQERKRAALAGLVDRPGLQLGTQHRGIDERYGRAYAEFLAKVSLPRVFVDSVCRRRYTRHFYDPEEIAQIGGRWLSPGS
jgi:hypothetical protein